MCTPFRHWLVALVIGCAISACGGDLTLPQDRSPAALEAVSGNGQEGIVGSRLDDPLVVKVIDASSQPVPGVAVEFEFTEEVPEAEVDPTQAFTDSSGRAAAQVRLGANTGTHTVKAQVVESATDLVATFDLTAVAPEKGKKGGKGRRGNGNGNDDDDDDDEDEDD